MKCWICGSDNANTREHILKKSDLKDRFGTPTQATPHFLNKWLPSLKVGEKPRTLKHNEQVRTLRSEELTYDSKLCAKCNNQVTQPHDRAWEKLSKYLNERTRIIRAGTKIRLHNVFANDPHKSMLNVHLFFVKQFAGLIVDEGIPISLQPFSAAILSGKPHSSILLVFISNPMPEDAQVVVGRSEVTSGNINDQSIVACYDYQIDRIVVRVIYVDSIVNRRDISGAYHPSTGGKCIEFVSRTQASHVQ